VIFGGQRGEGRQYGMIAIRHPDIESPPPADDHAILKV
jgi:hypothetical protein